MQEWQPFGTHLLRVEDDLVVTVWRGEVTFEDVKHVFELYGRVHEQCGRVFIMSDMRKSGIPSEKTRRWIVDWIREHRKIAGAAAYGANVVVRAVFIMLLRAVTLLVKIDIPVGVFATESEARIFIDQLRRQPIARS